MFKHIVEVQVVYPDGEVKAIYQQWGIKPNTTRVKRRFKQDRKNNPILQEAEILTWGIK